MFGHDDSKKQDNTDEPMVTDEAVQAAADTASPAYTPAAPGQPATVEPTDTTPSDVPPVDESAVVQAEEPADDDQHLPTPEPAVFGATDQDDLLGIKQDALQQLSPLVGHLDQTAEEKFRTTMMMIQASDDQSLIKDAYAAAKAITDDKTRAQALLDIINEINYFTRQG